MGYEVRFIGERLTSLFSLLNQNPLFPGRVMLSQGCLRSAGEPNDASRQCYLHMVRLEGGGMELPLEGLIIPYKFLALK